MIGLGWFILQEIYVVIYSVINYSTLGAQTHIIIQALNVLITISNIVLCCFVISYDHG